MKLRFRFLQLSLCVLLLACIGCVDGGSSDIGLVEGVVTVDGKPIDRATVTFYPAGGRSSGGYTDDKGHYSLTYTRSQKGALIGDHKVTISTGLEKDYLDGAKTDERAESMPKKYLDKNKTDLTATVEGGKNNIDFELKSIDF